MEEIVASKGGRPIYNDDLEALQNSINANTQLYQGEKTSREDGSLETFIISGCDIVGNTMTAGYVWIEGKIREVNSYTSEDSFDSQLYIVNKDDTNERLYEDDTVNPATKRYGTTIVTDISDKSPNQVLQIGGLPTGTNPTRLHQDINKKYYLTKGDSGTQEIDGTVNFKGTVNFNNIGVIDANGGDITARDITATRNISATGNIGVNGDIGVNGTINSSGINNSNSSLTSGNTTLSALTVNENATITQGISASSLYIGGFANANKVIDEDRNWVGEPISNSKITIDDNSITKDMLSSIDGEEAVVTEVIKDKAVVTDKIDNFAVTKDKIATETITGGENGNIGEGQIKAYNLGDGEVNDSKISGVSGSKINSGGLDGQYINNGSVDGEKVSNLRYTSLDYDTKNASYGTGSHTVTSILNSNNFQGYAVFYEQRRITTTTLAESSDAAPIGSQRENKRNRVIDINIVGTPNAWVRVEVIGLHVGNLFYDYDANYEKLPPTLFPDTFGNWVQINSNGSALNQGVRPYIQLGKMGAPIDGDHEREKAIAVVRLNFYYNPDNSNDSPDSYDDQEDLENSQYFLKNIDQAIYILNQNV